MARTTLETTISTWGEKLSLSAPPRSWNTARVPPATIKTVPKARAEPVKRNVSQGKAIR